MENKYIEGVRLADFLLQVYESARHDSISVFQNKVLSLLNSELPFDSAWWGRSTVCGNRYRVHSSCLYNLPSDTPERLNLDDPDNLVARRCLAQPDKAHWIRPDDWPAHPSSARLATHMGVEQVLSISRFESPRALVNFLALSRSQGASLFEPRDGALLECVIPHMVSALDLCCASTMAKLRQDAYSAFVMTDLDGWLYVSEPTAGELLEREWPSWNGGRLPDGLYPLLTGKLPCFVGRRIHAEARRVGQHLLLEIRRKSAIDVLSGRERAVAEAFASGQSYRDVAQALGLAPSTVRHHLRSVYMKLGVNDKAELAGCLLDKSSLSS